MSSPRQSREGRLACLLAITSAPSRSADNQALAFHFEVRARVRLPPFPFPRHAHAALVAIYLHRADIIRRCSRFSSSHHLISLAGLIVGPVLARPVFPHQPRAYRSVGRLFPPRLATPGRPNLSLARLPTQLHHWHRCTAAPPLPALPTSERDHPRLACCNLSRLSLLHSGACNRPSHLPPSPPPPSPSTPPADGPSAPLPPPHFRSQGKASSKASQHIQAAYDITTTYPHHLASSLVHVHALPGQSRAARQYLNSFVPHSPLSYGLVDIVKSIKARPNALHSTPACIGPSGAVPVCDPVSACRDPSRRFPSSRRSSRHQHRRDRLVGLDGPRVMYSASHPTTTSMNGMGGDMIAGSGTINPAALSSAGM